MVNPVTYLQGTLYPLKAQSPEDVAKIYQQGQKDGLDQLYVKAKDRFYVLEGEGLQLSNKNNCSTQLTFNGESLPAEILFFDDEINTALDGTKAVGQLALYGLLTKGFIMGTGSVILANSKLLKSSEQIVQGVATTSKAIGTIKATETLPVNINQVKGGVQTQFNARNAQVIREGIQKTESAFATAGEGIALSKQGATLASRQLKWLAKGMGLAVVGAGIMVTGGAIYGSLRNGQSAITEFKLKEGE